MKVLNILLSEIINQKGYMFGIKHCLIDLYKDCAKHVSLVKLVLRFWQMVLEGFYIR